MNIAFAVKSGFNRNPGDPYYYLFKLACEVAARRMNPTFMNMDNSVNIGYYERGVRVSIMGCRTYVASNVNGQDGSRKRGNMAPITIYLPRLGILSNSFEEFMEHLDFMLCKCEESLLHRYGVLKQLKVKDLPFSVGQGLILGSEGLSPEDSIEPVLKQGSLVIGFIGLAETMIALFNKHHGEDEEVRAKALEVVKHIRKFTDELTKKHKLNFACYASPSEGLSGRFTPMDRERFGIIPGVTDKDYYTNSYHVPVYYAIPMATKMEIESPYHSICNAGHISYIELDDYPTGEQIERIVRHTYETTDIDYMGVNFHIRFCKSCGKEIKDNECKCPECGSHDIQGISRITGYLALDERFGAGKTAERADRTAHNKPEVLGVKSYKNI